MKIGIHEAKTKLSKLIPIVLAGEEVVITKSGNPMVKLVPVQETGSERQLGAYVDKIIFQKDLLEPLPGEMIDDFWVGGDGHAISS